MSETDNVRALVEYRTVLVMACDDDAIFLFGENRRLEKVSYAAYLSEGALQD